jgi:hypothetical protein
LPKPGPRMRLVICSSAGDADDADAGHGAVLCARDDTGVCTNTLISLTQLAREGSPPPACCLRRAKLSQNSNEIARGRIRQFESSQPSQADRSLPANLRSRRRGDRRMRRPSCVGDPRGVIGGCGQASGLRRRRSTSLMLRSVDGRRTATASYSHFCCPNSPRPHASPPGARIRTCCHRANPA